MAVILNDEIAESLIKLPLDFQNLSPSEETQDRFYSLSALLDSGD
jgi:hypothetical protein